MYELFGDPALPIGYPKQRADVTLAATTAKPGTDVTITATLPTLGKGQAFVTLEGKRSTITSTIKPVPADGDATRDAVIAENYLAANDHAVAKKTVAHEGGTLKTTITVPANLAAGDYFLRIHADDGKTDAVGSAKLTVAP